MTREQAIEQAVEVLRIEFAKPQFMTMSSGNGKSSVEFTFHGDDRFRRASDLHSAFVTLGVLWNGPAQ